MSTQQFTERILRFVQARGYQPKQLGELALAMNIAEDELGDFHAACKALMRSGRVVLGSGQTVMLPKPSGRIVGTFRANPRGFGFVIPDMPNAHGDLYVPPGRSGDAITGDTVAARLLKRGKRGGKMIYEGRIVEVIKRGRSRFVGALHRQMRRWFVIPDGQTLHVPIFVGDPGAKGGGEGDQVVVELTQYPEPEVDARGVIVKVLGPRGEVDVETRSIIEQHQLPDQFDDRTLDEARDVIDDFDPRREIKCREDLRKLAIITIDPPDARDFDDAISLTRDADGAWVLGVHIADVAHFVRPDDALDKTAKERGNSVYLPRHVIPMLPEVLSNGVCSLQEREVRLTKSVFITYDGRGRVKHARLANTIIRSTKRLTYQQAAKILDDQPGRTGAKVVALLKDMETLARRIRNRRRREGMLELDLPDVELVHNDAGEVIDVVPADTSFPHKIIEMFMVEANEAVARALLEAEAPYLRRIHDAPAADAGEGLMRFLSMLGYDISQDFDRHELQTLLEKVRGKSNAFAVNFAVLRSLRRAEYSPLHVGHYALASGDYCHFTSPIRRYPDLTVHRLIDRCLTGAGEDHAHDEPEGHEDLVALGRHCSDTERTAEAAERELRLVLILQLLETHIGDAFSGVVTSVTNAGVFVQLEKFQIDGLLRFDQLGDDWWEIDGRSGTLLGELSGVRLMVGNQLDVVVSSVHLSLRRLDLALSEPLAKPKGGRKGRGKDRSRSGTRGKPKGRGGAAPSRKGRGKSGKRARKTDRGRSQKRGRR